MMRPGRGAVRQTAQKPVVHKSKTFPAPRKGWVVSENYAMQTAETALVLENWFPTTTGVRVRRGRAKRATLQAGVPVRSMWEYVSPTGRKRFAADATRIYDITTVADPLAPVTATVTGRTAGYYADVQMTTVGGVFQYVLNGADRPLLYNGTTFTPIDGASTPAITGVTTTTLSHGWVYANRLFFVQKGTQSAWALPVDSVGGAAIEVSLKGVFRDNSELLFGATWSLDAGDGLNQKCVFVSSTGEVAIYQGIDPSDPNQWGKEGVYEIGRPLGMKAIMRAGGDLLIATEDGLVALSEAVKKDPAALTLSAVSRAIEPEWRAEAVARATLPFEVIKWPSNAMMVVSLPPAFSGQQNACFVCNLQTGAWAKFTNWQTRCMAMFSERGFYGANDGCVYEMETGGSDDGAPYTANYGGAFDHLDTPGRTKTATMARAIFRAASPINPKISCSRNYSQTLPTAPASPANFSTAEWDVALWDQATWDAAGSSLSFTSQWVGIGITGYAIAPQVQLTYAVTPQPRAELVAFDLVYEDGGVIV
jgi:hypothetical protein